MMGSWGYSLLWGGVVCALGFRCHDTFCYIYESCRQLVALKLSTLNPWTIAFLYFRIVVRLA